MKRYIFSIILAGLALTSYGLSFNAPLSLNGKTSEVSLSFDFVTEPDAAGNTTISNEATSFCQFAAANPGEVIVDEKNSNIIGQGPNNLNWKIQDYVWPETVEYEGQTITIVGIGDYSFAGMSAGYAIGTEFPESYKYIGEGAFAGATPGNCSLKGIKKIGNYAFLNYGALIDGNMQYGKMSPNLFDLSEVEYIGKLAFYNSHYDQTVEHLDLRNAIEIGEDAFNTLKIKKISLGNHNENIITKIGKGAFVNPNNKDLTTLVIDGHIGTIGKDILYFCPETSFETLEITERGWLEKIEDHAFYGMGVKNGFLVKEGGRLDEIGDYAFATGEETVDGESKTISNDMFIYSLGTVKTIGKSAFYDCTFSKNTNAEGIDVGTNLIIPAGLEEMGEHAFEKCHNITRIEFSNATLENNEKRLKIIPDYAFYTTVESVTEIIISDYIEEIGNYAFTKYDYNDEDEHFFLSNQKTGDNTGNDTESDISKKLTGMSLKHLTLGKNVKKIGDYAFAECTDLESLTIPDATEWIGDYAFCHCWWICPLRLGKNVWHIGNYAFFLATMDSENCGESKFEFPSSLKELGYLAFTFNNTAYGKDRYNGQLTDLYVYATEPPKMETHQYIVDGETIDVDTFGRYYENRTDNDNFWSDHNEWMYNFLCLHVPQGCYEKYTREYNEDGSFNHWSQFSCIVDDLLPNANEKSIQEVVGYVFMQLEPNNSEVLTVDLDTEFARLFPSKEGEPSFAVDKWEVYKPADSPIIALSEGKGNVVTAKRLGQELVLGYDTHSNSVTDEMGETIHPETLVGAIMVFVCPTITVVYGDMTKKTVDDAADNGDETGSDEAETALHTLDTPASVDESSDYDNLVSENVSYQHRTVYNSYPKVEITTPNGIEISTYEKGHFDENGAYTNDYSDLEKIENNQIVGEGSDETGNYVVPISAVTENRLIKLSFASEAENPNEDDPEFGFSGIVGTTVSDGITVRTFGRAMHIDGADDNAVVNIYNVNGQLMVSTIDKTIQFDAPGIYIVKVDDAVFKATVR